MAASGDWLDAWDDCFNFFGGKSPYHTTRYTKLSHFTRNQRVGWKLLCALGIFIGCVFFQCLGLAWEGEFSDGRQQTPPLLLFGPMSALFSVIAMWIAAVHLYQPTFNGPRILLHYRRPSACSWEMLDWVFCEGSTTSAVVAFIFFWVVTLPYSHISLPGLHVLGNVLHLAIVGVDFYFTAPQFKANHVFLVLMWPVFWIFTQFLWVISGHQPSNEMFNFHSTASPVSTFLLFAGTVLVFYLLAWCSRHLHRTSDRSGQDAVACGGIHSAKSSSISTPSYDKPVTVPFGLVMDFPPDTCSPFDPKASSSLQTAV
ncbi:unnamed protein product [Hyaloperonospora brassicae]|uniref:Uncharacterized protein n=1 Tax=Hyaloperonospora brassicae TaxID=162125 RepID=A0AAV0TUH0_HYABA|nr:unnamed protein product [Hyaloperonospora brassicae]